MQMRRKSSRIEEHGAYLKGISPRALKEVCVLLACFVSLGVCAWERPNVLFLVVDDWNDMMTAMGDSQVKTPNLDKLAAQGMVFTNAHVPGVYCAPSRTAIMTGLQPFNTGCYENEPHMYNLPDHKDLPQYFKANGYKVHGGGKVYHHMPGYVDLRGFDEYFVWNEDLKKKGWPLDSWGEGAPIVQKDGPYSDVAKYTNYDNFDFLVMPNEEEEKIVDTITANWAADFLKQKHDQPFFLAYGTYAPHKPNYAPKKYFDMYPMDQIQTMPYLENDHEDMPPSAQKAVLRKFRKMKGIIEHGDLERVLQAYFASCSYADAMLGRVLQSLAESPYADNTIVVLWSDNGYHLHEKGIWAKHTLWERTTNVPFIWAGPGVPKGIKSDLTVGIIDTFKTLIDLCDLPENPDLDGESLIPVFNNPDTAKDRMVITTNKKDYSVVNRDWRYISRSDGEELYNLKKDPNEWTNLADQPELKAIKEKFSSVIPSDPVPRGKSGNRSEIILQTDGETFRWVKE
jgi:arylsulfatase A-like enzyme